MREPSLDPLLGRYEYKEGTSDKFWEIQYRRDSGMYLASWGRSGRPPQDTKEYSGSEALKKVQEKIAKGYRLVSKSTEWTRLGDTTEMIRKTVLKKEKPTKKEDFMTLFKKEIPE